MSLEDKINADIKTAMLAREKEKLEALRGVKAAILLAKTEKGSGTELNQEKEIQLLQKLIKQRKEAGEIYKSQNREDLSEPEFYQARVIEQYLPAQMDIEGVKTIIKEIIQTENATTIKDMGKVMGIASKKLAGQCDNKTMSEIIKKLLSGEV